MKSYVLTHDGLMRNLLVTTHEDEAAAKAWLDSSKKVGGAVVTIAEDLKNALGGGELVKLYNALAEIEHSARYEGQADAPALKPITKFETRMVGAKRCFTLIEALFQNKAPEAAAPSVAITEEAAPETETSNNEDDMATKGKKTAKKKAVKAAKAPKVKKAPKEKKAKADVDEFGLRKGSKSSEAARMFARTSGATMAKVKEAVGDSFYVLLGKLEEKGHKVKKDGKTIFLTAK